MSQPSEGPPVALLVLAPFALIGIWLAIGALLSEFSGWTALARRFPGGARPAGRRLHGAVVQMGAVSENNVTILIPTAEGLYLYSHPLFRFHRRPIFVPWREIQYTGERGRWWWRRALLEIGGSTPLAMKPDAYAALAPSLTTQHPTSGTIPRRE